MHFNFTEFSERNNFIRNIIANISIEISIIYFFYLIVEGYRISGGPGWTYLIFTLVNFMAFSYFILRYMDDDIIMVCVLGCVPHFCLILGLAELINPGLVIYYIDNFASSFLEMPSYFALPYGN